MIFFLGSLQIVDGDYLFSFTSIVNNTRIWHDLYSSKATINQFHKKYVDVSYFRYRYYADSGVGILIPTDENGEGSGDITEPPKPSQDDKTSEAINNQTNVIKEQTEAINNQTNAIIEQNNTSKSIWQTLLDLPRDIN